MTVDPAMGERRGDVLIVSRFNALDFAELTPEQVGEACAERAKAAAYVWATDNGRKPGETAEQFADRIRHGKVTDCRLDDKEPFVGVEPISAS